MEIKNKLFGERLELAQEKVDERLIMLCDGVFAIAMTLLVLDIKLDLQGGIDTAINALFSKIIIYIITFFIIASYWSVHRRYMRIIKRMNSRLIRITLLFLAFVTFFPVAFNLESENGHYAQVTIIYTLVLAGCGFSAQLLWVYASWKHRLIDPDLDTAAINYRTISGLSTPLVTCLSLLLIPFVPSPPDIFYSWLIIPVVNKIIQLLYERRQKRHARNQQQQTPVLDEQV